MRTKFKAWAEPYILKHKEVTYSLDDIKEKRDFHLEVGSGKGKFLQDMALANPDEFFVGVERNVTCSGFVAKKLVEQEIANAKLMWENADAVLMNIADESVKTIFLNFSDPWPKKRHFKRRLTASQYLDAYYRVLKVGGRLIIKTDQLDLYTFSLENFENTKFKLISKTENYSEISSFDSMTEYETEFRKENLPIYRIVVEK